MAALLKKRFDEIMDIVETNMVQKARCLMPSAEKSFSEFKHQLVDIENQVGRIQIENSAPKTDLMALFKLLNKIDDRIENQKDTGYGIKNAVDEMSKSVYMVTYNKHAFVDGIKLVSVAGSKAEESNENSLLFESLSELYNSPLKNSRSVFNQPIELKRSVLDSKTVEEFAMKPIKMKRTRSLLKTTIVKDELDLQLYASSINRDEYSESSLMATQKPTFTDTETTKTHTPNIPSMANMTYNKSFSRMSTNQRSTLNLYSPISKDGPLTRQDSKPNIDMKKSLLSGPAPVAALMESQLINPPVVVKNRIIAAPDLKRILKDNFKKNGKVDRIDFRDNVFTFDVLHLLKEHFTCSSKMTLQLDLRRNKIKTDQKSIESIKKHLLSCNVKLLI